MSVFGSDPAPARVARPLRMPRAQRRRQLIEVSREVFVQHGYTQTSMDMIAERAQVSKPVLYQHFTGKHELYLTLVDTEVDVLLAGITEALDTAEDNRTRTRSAVRAVFTYMADPHRRHRLLFDPALAHDPAVGQRTARVESAVTAHISALLTDAAAVSPGEAQLISQTIVSAMLTAARRWADELGDAGSPALERAVDLTSAVLWRGLARLD